MVCQICRQPVILTKNIRTQSDYSREASLDHIKPLSKGGETSARNLRTICRGCNSRKKNGNDNDLKFLNVTQGDFTRIHNAILLALSRLKLNSEESRILFAILAKTYGYSKAEDWISNSQLENITGIHRCHCSRTVSRLIMRGIVTKTGNKIKFNKYFFQWCELPKQATSCLLPEQATTVTSFGKKVLPVLVYTKDNSTKDILQKGEKCTECNGTQQVKVGKTSIRCPLCRDL